MTLCMHDSCTGAALCASSLSVFVLDLLVLPGDWLFMGTSVSHNEARKGDLYVNDLVCVHVFSFFFLFPFLHIQYMHCWKVTSAWACELNSKQSMMRSEMHPNICREDRRRTGCRYRTAKFKERGTGNMDCSITRAGQHCTADKCRPRIPLGSDQPSGGQASLPAIWIIQYEDK